MACPLYGFRGLWFFTCPINFGKAFTLELSVFKMTEERRTSMRDRRRSSVLPIELKTSTEKKPVVKIVIEQKDSRGDDDENESNFKEDEQNQVHQGAKVEEKLGFDDKVTVQLNTPYLERYINSSQSKSSLQSLESFTSFESYESSLVESEDDTNVQDEIIATPKPDLGDRVINALIVKRRKMMIDQDEEDVISYEESEIRIINFLLGLGIIFSIVICPLLFLHFQRNFQSTMEDKSTVLKELQLNFLEPKLTLLYKSTGMINTFVWKNQTLTKEWDKPLPSSTDYFPYFDNGYLNIIYGDGAKGMTYIDVKSPRNCHRVLPAGKLKHQILSSKNLQDTPEFYLDMQSLRVGNYLIWFGGRETHFLQTQNYQIFLWNIKRHKWYKGINLPSGIGGYTDDTWTYNSLGYSTEHMCGVGVNDTTAVFFGKKVAYNDTCLSCNEHVFDWEDTLTKFTLDLTTGKWVEIDTKFHSFSDVDNAILTNPIFACDSTFSKTSDV